MHIASFYYPPIFWERGKYGIVIMSNERNTFKPVLIKRSPLLSGRGHLLRSPNDIFFYCLHGEKKLQDISFNSATATL